MTLHLLHDAWIPVLRQDGTRATIRPADIARDHDSNPITELSAWRPDFDAALMQFLIGLHYTCLQPADEEAWIEQWEDPPSGPDLERAFEPIAPYFHLGPAVPRFMQDQEELSNAPRSIRQLLIDAPGEQTLTHNKDVFLKRDDTFCLGAPAAAMALLAMQLNAPSGGQGHRTSLRGGGPLSTWWQGKTLWQTVWMNILPRTSWATPRHTRDVRDRFPWAGPCRESKAASGIVEPTPERRLLYFWSTPRRIVLHFENAAGLCSISGENASVTVRTYSTKNYGENYSGPWSEHPLTPHYCSNEGAETIPVKGLPGGMNYRSWAGLAYRSQAGSGRVGTPAEVATRMPELLAEVLASELDGPQAMLRTTGYDLDNMKAKSFIDAQIPVPIKLSMPRPLFESTVNQMILASNDAYYILRSTVRNALLGRATITSGGKVTWRAEGNTGTTFFEGLDRAFLQRTEADFTSLVDDLSTGTETAAQAIKEQWLQALSNAALAEFDRATGYDMFRGLDPQAAVLARRELRWAVSPRAKKLRQTLGLPPATLQPPSTTSTSTQEATDER